MGLSKKKITVKGKKGTYQRTATAVGIHMVSGLATTAAGIHAYNRARGRR